MRDKTFYDKLAKSLGDAVADIREKVVEEPWFGRTATDREGASQLETGVEVSVSILTWPLAHEARQPEPEEHERDNGPDIDIDR